MKKLLSMLLLVSLCCGMLLGCSEKKQDVTKLPHNDKLSISDTQDAIMKEDNVVENDAGGTLGSYKKDGKVKLADKEYVVGYEFDTDDGIKWVAYESDEATLEEAQEYVDSIYGELEKTEYGEYIINCEGKVWMVRCLESANPIIFIARDTASD